MTRFRNKVVLSFACALFSPLVSQNLNALENLSLNSEKIKSSTENITHISHSSLSKKVKLNPEKLSIKGSKDSNRGTVSPLMMFLLAYEVANEISGYKGIRHPLLGNFSFARLVSDCTKIDEPEEYMEYDVENIKDSDKSLEIMDICKCIKIILELSQQGQETFYEKTSYLDLDFNEVCEAYDLLHSLDMSDKMAYRRSEICRKLISWIPEWLFEFQDGKIDKNCFSLGIYGGKLKECHLKFKDSEMDIGFKIC